jgi:hypothetical protein
VEEGEQFLMSDEIGLVSDGESLAVIGSQAAVERFLLTERLESQPLELSRLTEFLMAGAVATEAASFLQQASGRWVQLTAESSAKIQQFGLVTNSTTGLSTGVIGQGGHAGFVGVVQFVSGPGLTLLNPAFLAATGAMMTQIAIQRSLNEMKEYLEVIDHKLDDVIRSLKDSVLADLVGVELLVNEALALRTGVGAVSEVTWSKVQALPMTIARTQAYALRQLDGIVDRFTQERDTTALADLLRGGIAEIQDWLVVVASCVRLQDSVIVLELDRVLGSSPEQWERHRAAIQSARASRLEVLSAHTHKLIARVNPLAERAKQLVLLNPFDSPAVVDATNTIVRSIAMFQTFAGIDSADITLESRSWSQAVRELKDSVIEGTVDATERAKNLKNSLSPRISIKLFRDEQGEDSRPSNGK